jgi:hypothetical protein
MNNIVKSLDGIAIVTYAPTLVETKIQNINTKISMETDYPFGDTIYISIKPEQSIRFQLDLRIPDWCEKAEISIDGKKKEIYGIEYFRIDRMWEGEIKLILKLPMNTKLEARDNNLFGVVRGPLVYSLAIDEKWVQINEGMEGREYPHCDYELYATSPWNYGLRLKKDNLENSIIFEEQTIGELPFSPEGAPIKAKVLGSKIDWSLDNGSATPYPSMKWISDEIEELTLIPYGCTNLRITEMPLI